MLTTAGVTCEATASVAWSSASNGSMLALLMGAMTLSGATAAFTWLWPKMSAPENRASRANCHGAERRAYRYLLIN